MSSEDSSIRRRAGAGTHEGETEEIVSSSHDFRIHNFKSPTWCDHCGDLIYGLFRQGCKCADCGIATHHRCRDQVFMFCGTPPEGVHNFTSSTFVVPTWCEHCNEFMWGCCHQGRTCMVCSMKIHHKCHELVSKPCSVEPKLAQSEEEPGEKSHLLSD